MQITDRFEPEITSEALMNTFLVSSAHTGSSTREVWLARQTMLSLLRLARSEQLLSIRRSVRQLVPSHLLAPSIRTARGKRIAGCHPRQTQFVFGGDDSRT